MNQERGVGITVFAVLFFTTIFLCNIAFSQTPNNKLKVSFLDVGQGDAIFIESPTGAQMLIDGGPDRSVLRELGSASQWFDRHIDIVVATHPDSDHIGGLNDVLGRYRVDYVFESSVEHDTPVARALEESIKENGAEEIDAMRGGRIDLGGGAYADILFPDRDVSGVESNTGSIVLRLVYGNTSFIFTGDSPQAIEKYLVARDGGSLHADVLKVGHHGSKTSSAPRFVGYVSPEYAVLSRGCDNRYGHPHEEVLDTLKQFEIKVLDTCKGGTITFVSDGDEIEMR